MVSGSGGVLGIRYQVLGPVPSLVFSSCLSKVQPVSYLCFLSSGTKALERRSRLPGHPKTQKTRT